MSNQVTRETTIAQLIELGLMKASQVETYNKRLNRKETKKEDAPKKSDNQTKKAEPKKK